MKSKRIYLNAYGPANLFELHPYINDFIQDTEMNSGLIYVFSIGSTGALIQSEDKDLFSDWVMSFIPYLEIHRHPGNAFAHLRSTFLGSDMSLAIVNGTAKNIADLYLLENTAGRKRRPIGLRAFGDFKGGGYLNMKVASNKLPVESNGWIDIIDLTQVASDVIIKSGIVDGFLHIESLSKDSAISTTEIDGALLHDTADFFADMVKKVDQNKKGILASMIIGPSINVPIKDGRLEVGTWQQPVFIDFAEPGPKEIFFQAVGL